MQEGNTIRDLYEGLLAAHNELGEGVVIMEDKKILYANEAYSQISGYNRAELEALPSAVELIAPEERATLLERNNRRLGGYSEVERYESAILHKSGRRVEVEVALKILQVHGRTRFIFIVREITERKRADKALRESEERFRRAFEDAPIGVALVDLDMRYLRVNQALCQMLGYQEEEMLKKTVLEVIHPNYRKISSECARQALEGGHESYTLERRYLPADGHVAWHLTSVSLIRNSEGEPSHFVCLHQDITERKEAEEALKESEERFRTLVQHASDMITILEADGTIRYKSPAVERVLGYEGEEIVGTKVFDYVHPQDAERVKKSFAAALESPGVQPPVQFRFRHADGSWRYLESVRKNLLDDPIVHGIVVNSHDCTERKEAEERLEYLAFHDSLTGLPNRSLFLDRLGHALARTRREGGSVAVLLMDLDDFKLVNDSLGHDAGNTVLVGTAERLAGSLRPGDTVGRIFGDEFVVLLEAPSGVEEARRVAERIQESLREPLEVNGQEVFVRASIGTALGGGAEDEPEELLRRADLAMYVAKSRGKSQHEVYSPTMKTRAVERMSLERGLHRAVEREEFEVHYQPKVLLENGAIGAVEALVRWRHPDRGLLPASEFILLAEESGRINQIGAWVLRESCSRFRDWQERYPALREREVKLCVNLSAQEIRQTDLAEKVADVLRETGLDPQRLMLEISEKTAMEDTEYAICKLRELKDLGIKLALDDFGKGYCSLVLLEHSLLDALKIDRLLMRREKEGSQESAAIISALTNMGHSLGLGVIVEGVETEEQLEKLREMGCEMVQGYYFAKPLPSEALETLFREGVSW